MYVKHLFQNRIYYIILFCIAADGSNDVKSLNRKLDKHLVLLTKQKIGNKTHYLLPQGTREEGETMRQVFVDVDVRKTVNKSLFCLDCGSNC